MANLVKVFGCRQASENLHHAGHSGASVSFSEADMATRVGFGMNVGGKPTVPLRARFDIQSGNRPNEADAKIGLLDGAALSPAIG
jgi:hypothetical protein